MTTPPEGHWIYYEPPELFRLYTEEECGDDGYPFAWHSQSATGWIEGDNRAVFPPVKDLVRENAGNRCLRCGHPYMKGAHPLEPVDPDPLRVQDSTRYVSWSPCDDLCTHMGPVRMRELHRPAEWVEYDLSMHGQTAAEAMMDEGPERLEQRWEVEARWRILTTHHLLLGAEGKRNLLWWNLVSLCQRCHLTIQKRVDLRRVWPWPHTEWFRPYAAGWYAWSYLGERLSREETMRRLPELLALEGVTNE